MVKISFGKTELKRSTFTNVAADPIFPLNSTSGVTGPHFQKFPSDIESVDNFIQFTVYDHVFQTDFRRDIPVERGQQLAAIYLPLPNNLGTTYENSYKTDNLGVVGGAAVEQIDAFEKAFTESGSREEVLSALGQVAQKVGDNVLQGGEGLLAEGLGVGASEVVNLLGAKLGGVPGAIVSEGVRAGLAGLGGVKGMARNPHMAILYESPNFRSFQFTFDLKPKTREDSDAIREIIFLLKYYSAPQYSNQRHFFQYPQQFGIRLKHDEFVFRYGLSVLNNVTIEYHGEGTPLYYNYSSSSPRTVTNTQEANPNGGIGGRQTQVTDAVTSTKAPAAVTLSLTFTELKINTKREILAGR